MEKAERGMANRGTEDAVDPDSRDLLAIVLGRALAEMRRRLSISQEQLARRTGIDGLSRETVRRVEMGHTTTTATLQRLGDALIEFRPDIPADPASISALLGEAQRQYSLLIYPGIEDKATPSKLGAKAGRPLASLPGGKPKDAPLDPQPALLVVTH